MKLIKKILSGMILFLICIGPETVFAGATIRDLAPNLYEENQIKESTEYLQEESLSDKKERLPEEQKDLTFTKTADNQLEDLQGGLFDQSVKMDNSTASKAKTMGLFSAGSEDTLSNSVDDEEQNVNKSGFSISVIYSALIILGVAVLLALLIPGMRKTRSGANSHP
ncbi:type VII secretion protein EssA [Fictibacillus sp. 5RED26]|jgi:type VII secretion protein EssA|uniref:type VII secretion protein EssA n=1 Tax=Fictibacillus TaxID=1329200 RepID=UPI0018CCCDFF|nr:type VII secretion protein EssA [Fictibacillus sp. 5RED26]MBH0158207.1 type VII secretion protein EssA [Fictibacillus sp. 5RED26]